MGRAEITNDCDSLSAVFVPSPFLIIEIVLPIYSVISMSVVAGVTSVLSIVYFAFAVNPVSFSFE